MIFVTFLICTCNLNNQSPIPCNIKFKQSKKGKQKNTRNTLSLAELKFKSGT